MIQRWFIDPPTLIVVSASRMYKIDCDSDAARHSLWWYSWYME